MQIRRATVYFTMCFIDELYFNALKKLFNEEKKNTKSMHHKIILSVGNGDQLASEPKYGISSLKMKWFSAGFAICTSNAFVIVSIIFFFQLKSQILFR